MRAFPDWPRVMVGPGGQERVFKAAADVPEGWRTVDEAEKGPAGITFTPPVPSAAAPETVDRVAVVEMQSETPKQKAARKARERRAAQKAKA